MKDLFFKAYVALLIAFLGYFLFESNSSDKEDGLNVEFNSTETICEKDTAYAIERLKNYLKFYCPDQEHEKVSSRELNKNTFDIKFSIEPNDSKENTETQTVIYRIIFDSLNNENDRIVRVSGQPCKI